MYASLEQFILVNRHLQVRAGRSGRTPLCALSDRVCALETSQVKTPFKSGVDRVPGFTSCFPSIELSKYLELDRELIAISYRG